MTTYQVVVFLRLELLTRRGIMRRLAVYTVAVCSLIGTSCATMLKGTKDEITVVSDPAGAQVTANETQEGPTPVSFTVPRNRISTSRFRRQATSRKICKIRSAFAGAMRLGRSSPT